MGPIAGNGLGELGQSTDSDGQPNLGSAQIGISRGTGTGMTPVNEVAGSQFGASDLTQSSSSMFTLDGLNKALQSLQVDSSPSSELNRALTGWNS